MTHFTFSMQNCIHYFQWIAVLMVVTKPFLGETIIVKYGSSLQTYLQLKVSLLLLTTVAIQTIKCFFRYMQIWHLTISEQRHGWHDSEVQTNHGWIQSQVCDASGAAVVLLPSTITATDMKKSNDLFAILRLCVCQELFKNRRKNVPSIHRLLM